MFLLLFLLPLVVVLVMVVAVIVVMAAVVIVGMIVVVLMAAVMVVTVIMIMRMIVIMVAFAIVVMAIVRIMIVVVLLEDRFEVRCKGLFGGAIDLADRDATFGGDFRAGLEFRSEQRTLAMSPTELAVQLTDRRFDDARLPSTFRPLHQRTADAERRGLGEEDVFHVVEVGRPAENRQQHSGAVLFHLDRRREDFDRSRLEQFLFRVADDFGRDVIEVRFELDHLVGFRKRCALADEQPQEIGSIGEVPSAGTVADGFDSHRGESRISRDDGLQNGRAGRCGQLGIDRQIDQRNPLEQLGRAGSRDRADAVSNLDATAARWDWAGDDFIDSEQIESDRHADNVHNRVDRTDFVEMNFVDRRAMHSRLGLGDVLEDFERELLLPLGQFFGVIDELRDVGKMPVSALLGMHDFDLQCSEAPFDDRLDVQCHVRQAERINPPHDRFKIGSGVDQGRQSHVATNTAHAVEVRNPHDEILVAKGQSERGRILVVTRDPTNGNRRHIVLRRAAENGVPNVVVRQLWIDGLSNRSFCGDLSFQSWTTSSLTQRVRLLRRTARRSLPVGRRHTPCADASAHGVCGLLLLAARLIDLIQTADKQ